MNAGLGAFFLPPKRRNNIIQKTIKPKKLDESPIIPPPAANSYVCVLSTVGAGAGAGAGVEAGVYVTGPPEDAIPIGALLVIVCERPPLGVPVVDTEVVEELGDETRAVVPPPGAFVFA
jgi:hypothetical protein